MTRTIQCYRSEGVTDWIGSLSVFFFQAEDGIRDLTVTGVQTCALPIFQDVVYRTEDEKFRNAAKEIKELYEKGQPVLVGTISVEKSERLSNSLKKIDRKSVV